MGWSVSFRGFNSPWPRRFVIPAPARSDDVAAARVGNSGFPHLPEGSQEQHKQRNVYSQDKVLVHSEQLEK